MADSADLLEIPDFLKRETPSEPTRRAVRKTPQERKWLRGAPVQRPTRAQFATLSRRDWAASQVARLSRQEAAEIIRLGVGPEARFVKDKKHQFPGSKDDG